MTKLRESIHLDYVTVKPYFTIKSMLVYAAIALFLTTMSASITSGLGVGLMIATLFVSYPFALSEKNNLDALYATLSVNRKTVVQGRYIFTLLINIAAVLCACVLSAAGLLIAKAAGFSSGIGAGEGYLASILVLSAVFILVQAIQLPLFFKLGYAKAKILSVVPFAVLMLSFIVLMTMRNIGTGLEAVINKLAASGMTIPVLVVVLAVAVLISYRLSVSFYDKREF